MILINLISMRVPSFHFLYQGWPVYVQGLHLLNVTTDAAEIMVPVSCSGRRSGLMVSALVPGASGPGSSPGRGHCVVFLGKTLNSHSASLYWQEYKWVPANCWGNLTNCWAVTCDGLASRPGEVEILLAASCYKNRVKLRQL